MKSERKSTGAVNAAPPFIFNRCLSIDNQFPVSVYNRPQNAF